MSLFVEYGRRVLTKEGRDLIGSKKERRKTQTVDHFLLRNQYLIHFNIDQVMFEPNNLKWDGNIVINLMPSIRSTAENTS